MKYNGIELEELTEPQVINPPREMVVWDNSANIKLCTVIAILPSVGFPVATIDEQGNRSANYTHCAEIPEEQEKIATYWELAQWLAFGNGQCTQGLSPNSSVFTDVAYCHVYEYDKVDDTIRIRKWGDKAWHKPTLGYMGLADKSESKEDNDGQG